MAPPGKIRIAEQIEIEWLGGHSETVACPNCGAEGQPERLLDIDYRPPDAVHHFILQICPACTVRFVDNAETMDYATELLIEMGWNIYQVQLGAGVWPISAPLTRVQKPAGAKALEIGGAFGFGLDFCVRAQSWQGLGFDPSPLAGFGARELGLELRQDYFEDKDLGLGPWDVAMATEVLEHLPHPPEFLRLMRRALKDDGVLVLTTPDAGWITPELPAGVLMPLLSPGAHSVLQTAHSLEVALCAAGFGHVRVLRDGMSLVAYASAAPLALSVDAAAGRAMYRRYLVERARLSAVESDLRLGFAGRGLFEAANDGDWAAAEVAWAALLPAAQARFRLDLNNVTALPPGAGDTDLATLTRLMPLGLGMILFGRAMCLLEAGVARAMLAPLLGVALAAIAALQTALAKRSLTDGLSASIAGILEIELLLCRAAAGRPESVAGLVALGDEATGWRGFVELVNGGEIRLAAELAGALPVLPGAAIAPGLARNALLSLANFHLAPGQEALAVLPVAAALQGMGEETGAMLLGAFTRLVNGSRYDEALEMARTHDIAGLARRLGTETCGRDAALAQMVLDLAAGDPAEIPGRLQGLEIEPERRDVLLLEAFIRLVNAARYEEALAFLTAHEVPRRAARIGGVVARDAGLARAVLDLAVGDPADIPARLEGLDLPAARREALLLQAFIRLANAARHNEARDFTRLHDVAALMQRQGGTAAGDAAISMAVMELKAGDPAVVPGLLHGWEIDAAARRDLLLGAFTGLVNEARFEAAEAMAAQECLLDGLADTPGAAAADASWAAMLLDLQRGRVAQAVERLAALEEAGGDPAALAPVYVDAFLRQVNDGQFDAAAPMVGNVAARLGHCTPAARRDALVALLLLDVQPQGDEQRIAARLAALGDDGMDEAGLEALTLRGFATLANRGAFAAARALLRQIEPVLIKLRPPFAPLSRDALFAAGMVYLQDKDDWRRSAASFARLRDSLTKLMPPGETPEPLFWPALRGEVVALNHLKRGDEALVLLQTFAETYPGLPDDLHTHMKGTAA